MDVWDEPFDRARRDEIERVCADPSGAARAGAWHSLVLAIAPHIERQARASALLRRCGLTGEDEARWVLVDALERLSRNDHENLRAFRSRQRPLETGVAPQDALDTLGGLLEAEVTPEGDAVDESPPPTTPFRGWLRGLVKFTIRDHVRRRLGAPPAEGRRDCAGRRSRGRRARAGHGAGGARPAARASATDAGRRVRPLVAGVLAALWAVLPVQAAERGCLADGPFLATVGTLSPGGACDAFILTSDGAAGALSRGRARWTGLPERPYRVEMVLQRLDGDAAHSVAIGVLGGWILLRTGAWSYYEGEAEFAREGWRDAPAIDLRRPTRLEVEDRVDGVRIRIDGRPLPPWRPKRSEKLIQFELKAAPGERTRMWVRSFRVTRPGDPRR
jgi:hypothetical protein